MTREHSGLDDETLGFVLQTLNAVAERRMTKETRLEMDVKDEFPLELIQEMVGPEVGLHLLFLPEEVGGLGGGARDLFRVSEEMARIDLGVATVDREVQRAAAAVVDQKLQHVDEPERFELAGEVGQRRALGAQNTQQFLADVLAEREALHADRPGVLEQASGVVGGRRLSVEPHDKHGRSDANLVSVTQATASLEQRFVDVGAVTAVQVLDVE